MNFLKDVLRGVLIGVANVIPGVSGGTIALSMGIYEKILFAINHLKKDLKGSMKTLLPYIIGIIAGILGLSFVIEFLLENFPAPTIFAFIGLIMGGLPPLGDRVKGQKVKWTYIVAFLVMLCLVVIPTSLGSSIFGAEKNLNPGFASIVIMFLLGILASSSMVVPGVSGSMMLMIFGFYNTILSTVNICVKALVTFDFSTLLGALQMIIPFAIGVIVGIFLMAKIIEKLLKRYPLATIWGIIGLVVASAFAILSSNKEMFVGVTWLMLLISFVAFGIGFFIAKKMSYKE
ncbi:MAG: DUF368 domain-containing protein [Clostridia bacterium]|nr:DUF368 domain-containing protein [Clostridia bacterium]